MVLNKIQKYGELVMFSHSLFSLPFAIVSLVMAAQGLPDMAIMFWAFIALMAGRNGANAINRVIDATIDGKNPRTKDRHIPKGDISKKRALVFSVILFIIFEIAAYQINLLCFLLSPIALMLFVLYSYTKRFTWLCHLILGLTCGGAPVGAWIAVTGSFALTPFVIGAAVMFWIAGFDILYATQDIAFDKANHIYSIPAKFGLKKSRLIAMLMHFITWFLLIGVGLLQSVGVIYYMGMLIILMLLMYEHHIVDPHNKVTMKIVSYNLNQVVSVTYMSCFLIDFYF